MRRQSAVRLFFCAIACVSFFAACVPRAAAQGPVFINVVNGEVRDVLGSLAKMADTSIIIDDSVGGKITMRADAMDLFDALRLISELKGLSYRQSGGAILIGKKDVMDKNFGKLHLFPIRFADPYEAAAAAALALGEEGVLRRDEEVTKNETARQDDKARPEKRGMSKRLGVDRVTNALLFFGSEEEAAAIQHLLDRIDVPFQQVSLEAKVIAIDKSAAKHLGVEWEWSKAPQYPERGTEYETVSETALIDGKEEKITRRIPKETVARKWKDGESVPGVIQFGRGPDGGAFEFYYAAKLNALVANGKANILARPNITTLNGNEATINIGGEIPVPTASTTNSTTTTSFAYREAGIILKYTPRVNGDGYITADVRTEVSSPAYVPDLKAYRFHKRSAETVVRLKDGETMVIGGLIGSEETKSVAKVPFLGDLPILGQFFRSVKNDKSESEVMIFLTARIVK